MDPPWSKNRVVPWPQNLKFNKVIILFGLSLFPQFQESETREEELERVKVENKMLINKISDLMASRDQARFRIVMYSILEKTCLKILPRINSFCNILNCVPYLVKLLYTMLF